MADKTGQHTEPAGSQRAPAAAILAVPGNFTMAHVALLREWILRIQSRLGVSSNALVKSINAHFAGLKTVDDGKDPANRNVLRRLQTVTGYRPNADTLRKTFPAIWSALAADREYARLFPVDAIRTAADKIPPSDADRAIQDALALFFAERGEILHSPSLELLLRTLPGRYVMYRPDYEPAVRGLTQRKRIRASLVEIEALDAGLTIREVQDFPTTPEREGHRQDNCGVVQRYGHFLVALLRSNDRVSFKCMVIDKHVPFYHDRPLDEFSGKVLVASKLALFPAAHFVCRRIRGEQYQHGIYTYRQIPPNILKHLTTPTFPGFDVVA